MYLTINLKPRLFVIFVNYNRLTFGTFLQVALRWRIEKEVIDGKGREGKKIHFENENQSILEIETLFQISKSC